MEAKKLYSNHFIFSLYSYINVLLIIFLLTLLVLIFNQIYVLSRFGFVIFVGIHLALLFFVKVHYLSIYLDEENKKIEFHYNRKFGFRWLRKSRTSLLPLKQLESYKISKDSLGLPMISFFKKENKELYELGPFHVGHISQISMKNLTDFLGDPKIEK
jgi:energy-coupling factor transporter transmembrane protein EcfT